MFAHKQTFDAISQGIAFLNHQQQPDGSFLSYSSPNQNSFSKALTFHSTFSTSLILDIISQLPRSADLQIMQQKAATFLFNQKSPYWSFNYWVRESKEAKELPYPDDMDDTSCALAALFHHDATIINGSVLAHIVRLLTAIEVKEGGPYRTWLVSNTANDIWKDVDIAVNSNIAYFLSLQNISLPYLTQYIDDCILTNKLISPYYPSEYPIFYFISRFYKGKYRTKLTALLLAQMNQKDMWHNPLNTALALSTLIKLGESGEISNKAVEYLLQKQSNGYWKSYSFYTGVNPKRDKMYFAGSAALTTAFCLEALSLHNMQITKMKNKRQQTLLNKPKTETDEMYTQILDKARKFTQTLDKNVANQFLMIMQQITKKDSARQITLLPYYFARSLSKVHQNALPQEFIEKLGFANLLGWMAYTIYDDFFDNEGHKPSLSVANICLRELTCILGTLYPQESAFYVQFKKIMNEIDSANLWEVTHAFFVPHAIVDITTLTLPNWKKYELLAKRSLGHALGPLAIMYQLSQNEQQLQKLTIFFHHYIIAKQLNDDTHDFEEDLKKGRLTPVIVKLIKRFRKKQKTPLQTISLKQLSIELKGLFWYEILDSIASDIFFHIKQAKDTLAEMQSIEDKTFLNGLLLQLETATTTAVSERNQAIQFIKTYKLKKAQTI